MTTNPVTTFVNELMFGRRKSRDKEDPFGFTLTFCRGLSQVKKIHSSEPGR